MKYKNLIAAFLLCLLLSAGALAAGTKIGGTVLNGTTNQPAAGEEVVLISLANGMDETAHVKTDTQGRYTFNVPDDQAPHLIRLQRQSVSYFKSVPPGTDEADITIYDAATQIENVTTDARVFSLQVNNGSLEVADRYIIKNNSQPPRSRIGNQTFAVTLPDGAEFDHASTTGPSGMPLAVSSVPSGNKNQIAFDFAIRPGETRFEVFYKVPFNGKYEFAFTPESSLSELGVLLPKNMKFAGTAPTFRQDSDEGDQSVFFAKDVFANQPVKFSILSEGAASGNQSGAVWYLIGAAVGVVIGIALIVWRKNKRGNPAGKAARAKSAKTKPDKTESAAQSPEPDQGDMLSVLKEELFQLETDKLSGKISEEEYQKTKAGLDTLLRRQMKNK